ncbi:GTP pyrophosphokinase [Croceivirga radicis]|uniref:GTP pyrophosphokinase n=1 Tax=Croceivirga radicis TaxID=1929488 RepID=UPI000255B289|nr:RelA/SpoT domain-containing protein [Croceivirga radicis]
MKIILEEYDKFEVIYNNLSTTLKALITSLLEQKGIKVHQIETRVKERESLKKKILRKGNKYNSLSDITDIVGIRIITYFEDEIDQISSVIKKEFDIDKVNSIDKRKIETDKFGYRSLHYVASLKKERTKLAEYSDYDKMKFEFQIRSILQHSWAEIEHDLGYKGEFEIPSSAKRTFYRVAALLEQADIEFVKLKTTISEYESKIDKGVKEKPNQIGIDKASVISFVTTNDNVIRIENEIADCGVHVCIEEEDITDLISEKLISEIKSLGIENIKQLEELYLSNEESFISNEQQDFISGEAEGFTRGASIIWLIHYLKDKI